jgi:2-polyprenyl-3-methyl-5-hydroxy-6-metoxy-1,4-benzoquinol methylase
MSRYYPPGYYSFYDPYRFRTWKEKFVVSQIAKYSLNGMNPIGWWFGRKYPAETYPISHWVPSWLKGNSIRLNRKSNILDVGCGSGALLYGMRELLGLRALTGVDPFVESDIHYENGVKIIKAQLADINDQFDVIMLHHSFEHMPDPLSVLRQLRKLLSPKGRALIRTPICSSFAWRNYGVNWVQLDAPRHLFIHSARSFRMVAEQAGFEIKEIVYDSSEFQFWGSEQYKIGVPLTGNNSYCIDPKNSCFTENQINNFARMAKELNESGDGDQVCFFLEAA